MLTPFALSGLFDCIDLLRASAADPGESRREFVNHLMVLFGLCGLGTRGAGVAKTPAAALWYGKYGTELIVADTDYGIDPKQLPYVFDPSFTTEPRGTGLGLAVVRGNIHEG